MTNIQLIQTRVRDCRRTGSMVNGKTLSEWQDQLRIAQQEQYATLTNLGEKRVRYFVRVQHSHGSFPQEGYSKFFKRLSAVSKGKLRGPVYGLVQAREHIAELRKFRYKGHPMHRDEILEIVREVTFTKTVHVLHPVAPHAVANDPMRNVQ